MKSVLAILLFLLNIFTSAAQKGNLSELVPSGYTILDSAKCDLNEDNFTDYIIILKNDLESVNSDTARPLLILHGQENGIFKIEGRNDNIVFCHGCGGVFGDPYAGIAVKDNFFSVEHYGGSAWRWARVITFKYDKVSQKYILHHDESESFHILNPDDIEFNMHHKDLWGRIEFNDYHTGR